MTVREGVVSWTGRGRGRLRRPACLRVGFVVVGFVVTTARGCGAPWSEMVLAPAGGTGSLTMAACLRAGGFPSARAGSSTRPIAAAPPAVAIAAATMAAALTAMPPPAGLTAELPAAP